MVDSQISDYSELEMNPVDPASSSKLFTVARYLGLAKGGYLFKSSDGSAILVPHNELCWSTRKPTLHYLKSNKFDIHALVETDKHFVGSIKRALSDSDPWENVTDVIRVNSVHTCRLLWRREDVTVVRLGLFEAIVDNTKFKLDDFNNMECGYELELKIMKVNKRSRTISAAPIYDSSSGIRVLRNSFELFDGQSVRRVFVTFTPDYLKWFKGLGNANSTGTQAEIEQRSYSFVAGNASSGRIKVLRVFLPPDVILGYRNIDIPLWQDKFDELQSSSTQRGLSINAYAILKLPELLPYCALPKHWEGFIEGKIRRYLSSEQCL